MDIKPINEGACIVHSSPELLSDKAVIEEQQLSQNEWLAEQAPEGQKLFLQFLR